jgi:hypothetical protein
MRTAISLLFGQTHSGFSTTATILFAAALLPGPSHGQKRCLWHFGDATTRLVVSVFDVVALVAAAAVFRGNTRRGNRCTS